MALLMTATAADRAAHHHGHVFAHIGAGVVPELVAGLVGEREIHLLLAGIRIDGWAAERKSLPATTGARSRMNTVPVDCCRRPALPGRAQCTRQAAARRPRWPGRLLIRVAAAIADRGESQAAPWT